MLEKSYTVCCDLLHNENMNFENERQTWLKYMYMTSQEILPTSVQPDDSFIQAQLDLVAVWKRAISIRHSSPHCADGKSWDCTFFLEIWATHRLAQYLVSWIHKQEPGLSFATLWCGSNFTCYQMFEPYDLYVWEQFSWVVKAIHWKTDEQWKKDASREPLKSLALHLLKVK